MLREKGGSVCGSRWEWVVKWFISIMIASEHKKSIHKDDLSRPMHGRWLISFRRLECQIVKQTIFLVRPFLDLFKIDFSLITFTRNGLVVWANVFAWKIDFAFTFWLQRMLHKLWSSYSISGFLATDFRFMYAQLELLACRIKREQQTLTHFFLFK